MRQLSRALVVLTTGALALGGLQAPAQAAGVTLVSADPANGSSTNTAPASVVLTFSDSILPSSTLTVTGPSGASACTSTQSSPTSLTCTYGLNPTQPDGDYTAHYTANSAPTPSSLTSLTTTGTTTFTIDTVNPAAPTGIVVSPSPYNVAASNAGTAPHTGGLTITGSSEKAGDSVAVVLSGSSGGPVSSTATAGPAGSFTATFTKAQVLAFADGTLTLTERSTDVAGNQGAAAGQVLSKDVVPPSLTSTSPAAGGRARSTVPFAYVATGSEALGATSSVQLFDDRAPTDALATSTSISTTSITVTPTATLDDGNYTAKIFLADSGNNAGGEVDRAFTIDNTAPVAPVIGVLGVVNNANKSAHQLLGSGEPGATVALSASDGVHAPVTATPVVDNDGIWSASLNESALNDGTITYVVTQTDAAGNTGPAASPVTTTKDVVAPRVTNLASVPTSPAKLYTEHTVVTVTGQVDNGTSATGEADAVTVSVNDSSGTTAPVSVLGGAIADGTFSIKVDTASLRDGTLTISATAVDAVANLSSVAQRTVDKDTSLPATPTVSISPKPINSANQTAVTVSGATEPGASVRVSLSDGMTFVTTNVVASSSTGAYSAELDATTLPDGKVTAYAVATDELGNVSAVGSTSTTKDVVAPDAPIGLTAPAYINIARNGSATVFGRAEAGSTVSVVVTDAGAAHALTIVTAADDLGMWTKDFATTTLNDGAIGYSATVTDVAGNMSSATTTTSLKDTVAPVLSGLTGTNTSNASPSTSVTGSRSETSALVLSATDGVTTVSGSLASETGAFTTALNLVALVDGPVTVTVTPTDTAGNAGSAVALTTYKDATAPAIGSLAALGSTLARPTSTVTGSRSETSAVAISATDGSQTVSGSVPSGTGAFSVDLDLSGLADGTVTVSAVATDSAGNLSDPVTTTTTRSSAKAAATVTLAGLPTKIIQGAVITLRGTVTRPETGTTAGSIRLETRSDAGVLRVIRMVPVSSTGAFAFAYRPTVNGRYTADYLGDAFNSPAVSPQRRTLVATRITASSATAAATTNAVIRGNLTPNKSGSTVTLYRVSSTGGLTVLARSRATSASAYSFSLRLPKGRQTLQVGIAATSGNASGSVRLVVTRT